jgi:hypothetical protein
MENGSLLTGEQNEILIMSLAKLVKGAARGPGGGRGTRVEAPGEDQEMSSPAVSVVASMEVEERSSEFTDYNFKLRHDRLIVEAAQEGLVQFSKPHPELIFSHVIPKLLENIGPEELDTEPEQVMDSLKALLMLSGSSSGLFKSIMMSLMGLLYGNVGNVKFLELILDTASNCISVVPSQNNGEVRVFFSY